MNTSEPASLAPAANAATAFQNPTCRPPGYLLYFHSWAFCTDFIMILGKNELFLCYFVGHHSLIPGGCIFRPQERH